MNYAQEVHITRRMIQRSLMKHAKMTGLQAWLFSEDLDMSIEEDYLPIDSWLKRYRKVVKDCLKFVECENELAKKKLGKD